MTRLVGLVVAAVAMSGLEACGSGALSPANDAGGTVSAPADTVTIGAQSSSSIDAGTAALACAQHAALDPCLADVANECFWGPNYGWPVLVDGDPCEPPEGTCQSWLAPSRPPACTVDPTDDAACRADATMDVCLADTQHRCWWTPLMGIPCSLDGSWCPPPPHCETSPTCPPRCTSTGPTISVPVRYDCGCLTPPGGVCIFAPGDPPVSNGCAERPACDVADICSCLTGLGTCTPGQTPNTCICAN
jgi:hypothetical protein